MAAARTDIPLPTCMTGKLPADGCEAADMSGGPERTAMTTPSRPKLLVLGGPTVDPSAVGRSLGDQFEVVTTTPQQAVQQLGTMQAAAVLADAGDFLPLERDLVARQSAILLNAIGEGVCLCADNGRVLWSNAVFDRMEDRVRKRVTAACRHALDRFTAESKEKESAVFRPRRYTLAFNKLEKFYDATITPVLPEMLSDAPRQPGTPRVITQVVAVVRDVTARRMMQRKIELISQAGGELVHMDAQVVKDMHVADRLKMIEDKVIHFAHELLNFDHFAIRLLNRDSGVLDLVMSKGLPQAALNVTLHARPTGNGISGYVAATGRSYICTDCTHDPLYVAGIEQAGSSLTVPLRMFDKVIGIFNIESEKKDAFTDTDRQFAEIFSQYVAMALHILNLLLVERYTTSQTTTGTVQGELSEPLNDLMVDVEQLKEQAQGDPVMRDCITRIMKDADSIRKRVKRAASGPRTLLGADEAINRREMDPVLDGRRVLVADNEAPMLEVVRDILRSRGAIIVTSDTGGGAIKLLDQWAATHDAEEGFDLIISDINLGDKTGYDVFAAAKHADVAVPVILMTGFGYDPHHSIVRASQEGLSCVLFKPFQAEKLVTEAKNAITSRASGPAR